MSVNQTVNTTLKVLFTTLIFVGIVVSPLGCDIDSHFNSLNTPEDRLTSDELDVGSIGKTFAYIQYHAMRGQFGGGGYNQINIRYADHIPQYIAATASFVRTDNLEEDARMGHLGWLYFYENVTPQLGFLLETTEEQGLKLENAVAKVWKVMSYSQMTDVWGPIPYSEANSGGKSIPYDSQEEIYKDFFKLLDEAIPVLNQNKGATVFGSDDIIYDGDVDKWIKFANSLRLRLALRVKYVDPNLAQQEAEKAVSGELMTTPDDVAKVLTTSENRHPLTTITAWGEFRTGAAVESVLEGYEDPRLTEYMNPAAEGDQDGDGSPYEGLRNGLPPTEKGTDLNDFHSHMDSKWLPLNQGGENPPIRVMGPGEVYFLRAEGALEGWNMGGSPEELYNQGIRLSLEEKTDATDQEIEKYISSSKTPKEVQDEWNSGALSDIPVKFESDASKERKLEQIITQKWIELYPNGWEAWTEYRRTRYPDLFPLVESLHPDIPKDEQWRFRRLTFTSGEYDNNREAVEEAISLLDGPDENTTSLWWQAKPLP